MEHLIDTEDRIALAVQFSNECLSNLRTRMETYPDLFVVKLARFAPEKRGWYSAADHERAVPSVRRLADTKPAQDSVTTEE
jgi:hypothetical protein